MLGKVQRSPNVSKLKISEEPFDDNFSWPSYFAVTFGDYIPYQAIIRSQIL